MRLYWKTVSFTVFRLLAGGWVMGKAEAASNTQAKSVHEAFVYDLAEPRHMSTIALAVLEQAIFMVMLSNDKANKVIVWTRPDRDVETILRKERRGVTLQRSMLQHVLNSPIFL
jgi:hypothetical protein